MAHYALPWRKGQYVLKAADTDGTTLDAAQLRVIEECFHILRLDVTVPMKVREDTSGLLGLREIHDKEAASRCEHAPYLAGELLAHWPRQMVQHQRAQDHVELRVFERQSLGDGILERHLRSGLPRGRASPRDHLGRRVNAEYLTG
jgi:hypothetical protein